jgi:hypothetical protein
MTIERKEVSFTGGVGNLVSLETDPFLLANKSNKKCDPEQLTKAIKKIGRFSSDVAAPLLNNFLASYQHVNNLPIDPVSKYNQLQGVITSYQNKLISEIEKMTKHVFQDICGDDDDDNNNMPKEITAALTAVTMASVETFHQKAEDLEGTLKKYNPQIAAQFKKSRVFDGLRILKESAHMLLEKEYGNRTSIGIIFALPAKVINDIQNFGKMFSIP